MTLVKKKYDAFLFPTFSKERKDKGSISTGTEKKWKIERFAKQMFGFLKLSTKNLIRNERILNLDII